MNSERHGRRRERESKARDERKIEGGKRRFERRLLLQSTSVVTAHSPIWSNLRFPSAQIENIRPRLLSLLPPQRRGGEGRTSAAHLAPPLPSRAEVEALLGVGAWPAVLVTVPKLPQNGLLRSLPLSLPPLPVSSLSLSLSPSMLSWRITTHPRKTRALYPPSHLPSFLRPPSSPFSRTHPPDRLAFPAFPTSPSRHSTRWTNVTTSVRARSRDRAPGFIAPTVFASRPRLWG